MEKKHKELTRMFRSDLAEDKLWIITDVAKTLLNSYEFKIYNDLLYAKFDDEYITNTDDIISRINLDVDLTKRQYNELLFQIKLYAEKIDYRINKIKLNNGILTLSENGYEVIEDDGSFCPYRLDVNYDKDANDEHVLKFMNDISCKNKDIYNMLVELIGCVLITEPKCQYMFFIHGNKGRNGKSTFTSMLRKFLGEELTSNISILGLKDETKLSKLNGKLLNICDDADYEKIYLERSQMLKSLASGELINCRAIYSYPIEFYNTATIVCTSNNVPEFSDKSGGMRRRLIIIEFNKTITKETNNPNLIEEISTPYAKSTILNLAIKGMNSLLKNNYYITENDTLNKSLEEYYKNTDTVKDFIESGATIDNTPVPQVYEAYTTFCDTVICKEKESKNVFGMRLKQYGYISKPSNSKQSGMVRIYKKVI